MTHHGPSQIGSSCPLRSRPPCGVRSLPSIPPCSVLSASPRSALRLPFGLPSLAPFGARLRFGGLSSPNRRQVAPCVTQGQWTFAKSRRSPHLSSRHPQVTPPPSPVLPQSEQAPGPSCRRCDRHRGLPGGGDRRCGRHRTGRPAPPEHGQRPRTACRLCSIFRPAHSAPRRAMLCWAFAPSATLPPPRRTRPSRASRSTRGPTSPIRSAARGWAVLPLYLAGTG